MESWITLGNIMISGGADITITEVNYNFPLEGEYINMLEYEGYYDGG